jgi:hypothetical protein
MITAKQRYRSLIRKLSYPITTIDFYFNIDDAYLSGLWTSRDIEQVFTDIEQVFTLVPFVTIMTHSGDR